MGKLCLQILFLIHANFFVSGVNSSATFTFLNKCKVTVWPGISTNAGTPPLLTTGFALQAGESKIINAPSSWSGRFWGRTQCTEDSSGKFSCVTGDCGSGKIECAGDGAAPPATLVEFNLDGVAGMDFYDVSLVDGYNLPTIVVPQGGSGINCSTTGCVMDLKKECPLELRVTSVGGEGVACKSACDAFGKDQYCCSGGYGTPDVCKPSQYSQAFKSVCPKAYSYAYDDRTSTFTCSGADYSITFCPSPNNTSRKSSSGEQNSGTEGNRNSSINSAMLYEGALDESGSSATRAHALGVSIAITAAMWPLRHRF